MYDELYHALVDPGIKGESSLILPYLPTYHQIHIQISEVSFSGQLHCENQVGMLTFQFPRIWSDSQIQLRWFPNREILIFSPF